MEILLAIAWRTGLTLLMIYLFAYSIDSWRAGIGVRAQDADRIIREQRASTRRSSRR